MGQKTNPIGMRLGIIANWDSRWFARKDYAKLLEQLEGTKKNQAMRQFGESVEEISKTLTQLAGPKN